MSIKNSFRCSYHTSMGLIWLQFKQPRKAEDAFIRAVSLTATAAAYCGLGISLLQQNKYESATDSFWEAVKLDPGNGYNLKWLYWAEHLDCHQTQKKPHCRHCIPVNCGVVARVPFKPTRVKAGVRFCLPETSFLRQGESLTGGKNAP